MNKEQLPPSVTWHTCGPANTRNVGTPPKGCEEWSPTAWFELPDLPAGRVGVDHGVDGKPHLLVSTNRDDQRCEAFAVMTPSGDVLTAAAFAGPVRLGAPVAGEGVVALGVEVRVDDDEDNSSMTGVEFVGTETAVPPFLKPVSETPN